MYSAPVVAAAALLTAFLIAYFATPFAMKAALRAGAIDMPGKAGTDSARHLHKKPTPRMGGLAIFVGFVCSALLFAPLGSKNVSMLAGATIIVLLGVFDDIYDLPAMKKLVVQLAAAAVAVLGGNKIYFFSRLMSLGGHWDLGILSIPVTLLWIVLITNAVNLIDGLDGLAAGVSTISCVSLVIIALGYSNPSVAIITSALAGGCIGFLPYNRPPAKIFMGDTGSTLLGYVMAVASIQGLFKFYAIISFVIPFLMLGVPIFDTCFAVIRRLHHGESPFKADREHVHYRLMDMGFSKKQTVAVLYGVSALLGLTAVVTAASGLSRGLILLVVLSLAGIAMWKGVGRRRAHLTLTVEEEEELTHEELEEREEPEEEDPSDGFFKDPSEGQGRE